MVRFDPDGKIRQIRLHWDQASLLKHIEVIGARGKMWPISDGIDQIRLIASCDEAASKASALPPNTAPKAKNPDETTMTSRTPRARAMGSNNNVTGDPHASLSLFAPRENDKDGSYMTGNAPRASARPPPRDYQDLFVGGDSDRSTTGTTQRTHVQEPKHALDRSTAPKAGGGKSFQPSRLFAEEDEEASNAPKAGGGKSYQTSRLFDEDGEAPNAPKAGGGKSYQTSRLFDEDEEVSNAPKAGGGKSYQPSRLFDEDEAGAQTPANTMTNSKKYHHFELAEGGDAPEPSPYKTSPKKYSHFEFGDGSDPADAPKPHTADPKASKHASQWEFEDFNTPAKVASKIRSQDVRHFGWSYSDDDDNNNNNNNAEESPVKAKRVPKPVRTRRPISSFKMMVRQTPIDIRRESVEGPPTTMAWDCTPRTIFTMTRASPLPTSHRSVLSRT